jgi:iron(III) transport system substrate-binding protein
MSSAITCRFGFMRALLGAAALAIVGGTVSAQTTLVVYSTLEQEYIDGFRRAFEADNPDIKIDFLRDATGVITARLQAEKAQPRADAAWGLAVTSMMVLNTEGILEPYTPAHFASLKPEFRDPAPAPAWFGMEAWSAAVCFNVKEAAKLGLPTPTTWEDLTKPIYKGRIQMPNPASSGTGFFHVSGWIQMMGEAKAWEFMDRLHQNVATYVHSGSKPCRDAATGEFPVGIAYELLGSQLKTRGAPIETLIMAEGAAGTWMRSRSSRARAISPPRGVSRIGRPAARPTSSTRSSRARWRGRASRTACPTIRPAWRNP